jgi:hypothetical protein
MVNILNFVYTNNNDYISLAPLFHLEIVALKTHTYYFTKIPTSYTLNFGTH